MSTFTRKVCAIALVPTLELSRICPATEHPDATMASRVCTSCKASFGADVAMISYTVKVHTYYRCCPCNSWGGRWASVRKQLASEDDEVMSGLSAKEKKEFMIKHKDLLGEDLKRCVETFCQQRKTRTQSNSYKAKAKLTDEVDLKDKYQHKPEQLTALLEGPSYLCPLRKVLLYQDPEYEIEKLDVHEEVTTTSVDTSTTKVHAAKRIKTASSSSRDDASSVPAVLSPDANERMKLKKHAMKLSQGQELLEAASVDKFNGFIPDQVKDRSTVAMAKGQEAISTLELSLSDGWTGEHAETMAEVSSVMENIKFWSLQLKRHTKGAEDIIDEGHDGDEAEKKKSVRVQKKSNPKAKSKAKAKS